MRLSREGEADNTSGRVGSDPSAIWKETRLGGRRELSASAPAAS